MDSVKKNFIYNSGLTISTYLINFITYPYTSRVLGVANIGIYNFIDSIVTYTILFCMMGISIVGSRETAKYKNDSEKLSVSFNQIFKINCIFTLVSLSSYLLLIIYIPELNSNKDLLFIGGIKILFNIFLVEWFFIGIENFKFISIRALIIKIVYALSIFIVIKNSNDLLKYYFLNVILTIINALINWYYLGNTIKFYDAKKTKNIYIKPAITLGLYMILTSTYTIFNIIYLGFITNKTEVGYYTTAVKLYSIIVALFTAYTAVIMPRVSALVSEGKIEEVKALISKSYNILIKFTYPVIIFSITFAPQIINIIAGPGYEGSVLPMRIIMILMFVVGCEQILIMQILIPLKKDNIILKNAVIAAVISLVLNIFITPLYKSTGSAMIWVLSETVILICSQISVKKYIDISIPYDKIIKQIILTIPIITTCLFFYNNPLITQYMNMVIAAVIIICYWIAIQLKINLRYKRIIKICISV